MSDRVVRYIVAASFVIIVGAPAVAVLARFSGAAWFALALGAPALLLLAALAARHVPPDAGAFARERPVIAALWLLVAFAAVTLVVRLSAFAYDSERTSWSALPTNPFLPTHFCFSGYWEGERFARAGDVNIYDPRPYVSPGCEDLMTCPERAIGNLKVDLYQYPPTFLVIPAAIGAVAREFFNARALWFLVQIAAVAAGLICTARWIGGAAGRRAAAMSPLLFIALPTLVGIQIGNIQATTFAVSMLAMLAIATNRTATGGLLLGLMISAKAFPGLLAAWLLGALRWRGVIWAGVGVAACAGAVAGIYGLRPFQDFIVYQAPRVASGEAFFWIDTPVSIPPNYGIHGLVAKMRLLGLDGADRSVGNLASSAYGFLLGVVALYAGWQRRHAPAGDSETSRMQLAQFWLALLNLGSFRSPFVPDAYAAMGTIWLLTLLVAGRVNGGISWRSLAPLALILPLSIIVDGFIPPNPPAWVVVLTLGNQLLMLALNFWVVGRELFLRERISVSASALPAPAV
jgi:alpha-1,2-mannosyltransferase